MRKLIQNALLIGLVISAVGACATRGNSSYGNFADASIERNQTMAEITVSQLAQLYPPAHTRFNLQQTTMDAYGTNLVRLLRDKGYALMEYTPGQGNATGSGAPPSSTDALTENTAASSSLDLRYIIDMPVSSNFYRLTVTVGTQSITRAFAAGPDGKLYPAGAWARKE